jgi:predicted XRE-type DNA-binding protein
MPTRRTIVRRGVRNGEEEAAKNQLAELVKQAVAHRDISQYAAARIIGVDQPKISAVFMGRLVHFSSERLIRFLVRLGYDVDISVKPKPRSREQGRLRVVAEIR